MLLRSDNRLSGQLAGLFMIPRTREGVDDDVPMLFLLLRHSKVTFTSTIKQSNIQSLGKLEYNNVFRHKDVQECTTSAMAFSLFLRFHVVYESCPDICDMLG